MKEQEYDEQEIHGWFGLSYASYLVLPRLALQAMPGEWQSRFLDLMAEMEAAGIEFPHEGTYDVRLRDDAGRFIEDPLRDYRHGKLPVQVASPLGSKSGPTAG